MTIEGTVDSIIERKSAHGDTIRVAVLKLTDYQFPTASNQYVKVPVSGLKVGDSVCLDIFAVETEEIKHG